MIRAGVGIIGIGLLGLFGYYFLADHTPQTNLEKAKGAAIQVGDTVRDKGVASLVDVRLKSRFGMEATRFLHVYYDAGRIVVYGMAPADMDPAALSAEAASAPGVDEVEVFVTPRPAYVESLPTVATPPAPQSPDAAPEIP